MHKIVLVAWIVGGCWRSSQAPAPAPAAPDVVEPQAAAPTVVKADEDPSLPKPLIVRVLGLSVGNGHVLVTIKAGREQGIDDTWHAQVLEGSTDLPLANGELQIIKVEDAKTSTHSQMTVDEIKANTRVRLTPP
jgi:hypothetical protein